MPPSEVLTPHIFNVDLATSDTEVSQALPPGCKGFMVRVRGVNSESVVRMAYAPDVVVISEADPGPHLTLAADGPPYISPEKLCIGALTLYFAASDLDENGEVVEIEAWT